MSALLPAACGWDSYGCTIAIAIVAVLAMKLVSVMIAKYRADKILSRLPVPPGSLPFLGHALELGKAPPWVTIHNWILKYGKKEHKYMIKLDFLMTTGVVLSDPSHIKHVFDRKQRNYPKDIEMAMKPFLAILGKGIVTSKGEDWKRQRELLRHPFRIEILEETAEVAKRAVDRLSNKIESFRGTGKTIELAEEFRVMTLQVIGELILSMTPDESARVFPKLYLPIVEEANRRVWEPWRPYLPTSQQSHYRKTVKELNSFVADVVRKRWQKHRSGADLGKGDILDKVLESIDPTTWGEHTVSQLTDEIKTFLLAGHETSASMLTWTIYELCRNPEIRERVLAEGKNIFSDQGLGQGDDKFSSSVLPDREELAKLTYTVNALKESLRLYTLVPMVARICEKDDVIDGQHIPAGSKIFLLLKTTHENPELWPEPEKFRPERFEESFNPYNFNAFINGPRNCLGQHLALIEARIVLSLLCQRFKFSVSSETPVEVHPYMVPTCPLNGVHVTVE